MGSTHGGEKQLTSDNKLPTSQHDPNGLPSYSQVSATGTSGNEDAQLLARLGYKQVGCRPQWNGKTIEWTEPSLTKGRNFDANSTNGRQSRMLFRSSVFSDHSQPHMVFH